MRIYDSSVRTPYQAFFRIPIKPLRRGMVIRNTIPHRPAGVAGVILQSRGLMKAEFDLLSVHRLQEGSTTERWTGRISSFFCPNRCQCCGTGGSTQGDVGAFMWRFKVFLTTSSTLWLAGHRLLDIRSNLLFAVSCKEMQWYMRHLRL